MKICFICPKAYPLFNENISGQNTFGGAEVQLYLLAKSLSRRGNDPVVHLMVADYQQPVYEVRDNIHIWKAVNFKQTLFYQIINFISVFKKVDADIYIQRTLTVFSGLIAFFCLLFKKKLVYMVAHDSETDGKHRLFQKMHTKILSRLVFKWASLIICQNQYQRDNLLKKKITSVILKSSYEIKEQPYKTAGEYCLWVGRSERWKQPELLIQLAANNPDQKFLMICPKSTYSSADYYQQLLSAAREIKNLTFIQSVPFSRIDEYFQKGALLINTSIQEGFSNTFVQAAKNSVPILSLNVNPDDFLDHYQCGFYCRNNLGLMQEKIDLLLNNQQLYSEMAANALQYAQKNHEIKKNIEKLLNFLYGH